MARCPEAPPPAARYEDLLFDTPSYLPPEDAAAAAASCPGAPGAELARGKHGRIKRLRVYVGSYDQSLNLQTDESYALAVAAPTSTLQARARLAPAPVAARLSRRADRLVALIRRPWHSPLRRARQATTVYGALRGLETFSQLVDRVACPPRRAESKRPPSAPAPAASDHTAAPGARIEAPGAAASLEAAAPSPAGAPGAAAVGGAAAHGEHAGRPGALGACGGGRLQLPAALARRRLAAAGRSGPARGSPEGQARAAAGAPGAHISVCRACLCAWLCLCRRVERRDAAQAAAGRLGGPGQTARPRVRARRAPPRAASGRGGQ